MRKLLMEKMRPMVIEGLQHISNGETIGALGPNDDFIITDVPAVLGFPAGLEDIHEKSSAG